MKKKERVLEGDDRVSHERSRASGGLPKGELRFNQLSADYPLS